MKYTTSYNAVGGSKTTMAKAAGQAGAAVGDIPPPTSNEERTNRAADGDGDVRPPGAAKLAARREDVEMRYDAYVWVDVLSKYWVLFIVGNLMSAAVVVIEIWRVNGCFDDVTERQAGATGEIERDSEASIRFLVIAILAFGLVTEFVIALVLCFVYGSPLDIKSFRKMLPHDVRACETSIIVNLVAPFSWGVVYTCGSFVSLQIDTFSSCGGHEGSVLDMYLVVSGWAMLLVGLGMLGFAGFLVIFIFSCGPPSPNRPPEECCTADKRLYGHRVLSKAALLDMFWQLQGSVWLYRTGGIGGRAFIILIVLCIVGALLAALGSRPSASTTQELPGSPPLVLTQPPDAADRA